MEEKARIFPCFFSSIVIRYSLFKLDVSKGDELFLLTKMVNIGNIEL